MNHSRNTISHLIKTILFRHGLKLLELFLINRFIYEFDTTALELVLIYLARIGYILPKRISHQESR